MSQSHDNGLGAYDSIIHSESIITKSKQSLTENLTLRSIKILDIGFIFIIYFAIAFILVIITDKILGEFDPVANKMTSNTVIIIQLLLQFWIYGVLVYLLRNIVELIPFPLDGYKAGETSFEHKKVKELGSAWVFGYVYLAYSTNMKSRLTFLYNRFMGKPNPTQY
jgi:hypothetical protein